MSGREPITEADRDEALHDCPPRRGRPGAPGTTYAGGLSGYGNETHHRPKTRHRRINMSTAAGPPDRVEASGTRHDSTGSTRVSDERAGNDGLSDHERAVREKALAVEREAFGGVKVGSAFFGWLTATGMAVLLTALVAAAGTAVGVANGTDAAQAATDATKAPGSVGLVGGIVLVLVLVLFVAYYCGGYVAARMARFNGTKQGLAVWLWAVVVALVVAGIAAVAGSKYDVLSRLNSFPRIPVDGGTLTKGGLIALLVVAVASLLGALIGGRAGMHYHRKIDRAGLEA
jgi:hypothetical protein